METRAIVLVAGSGTRMGGLTRGRPKCLLWVEGETLLGRNLRMLRQAGVSDITLVTGFRDDMIRAAFPSYSVVRNPDHCTTDTAASLQLALRRNERGSVLVINGDVYVEDGIIERLVALAGASWAAVRPGQVGAKEVKVVVDGHRVCAIGKQLSPQRSYGEALGLYHLTPAFASDLEFALRRFVDPNTFYELGMDLLLGAGAEMRMLDVGHALAMELDTPDDFRALLTAVADRRATAFAHYTPVSNTLEALA